MVLRVNSGAQGFSAFRRIFGRPLWVIFGVAAGILLIACSNVASLMLARKASRSGETAMRVSLGAGRARLVRQMLTESLLLSAVASCLGLAVAAFAAPALVRLLSKDSSPLQLSLAVDSRVLFFCVSACTLCALFFGFLPAWKAAETRPLFALRHEQG
jgi:ABC-type antimicrobial peptide transport system permease subunit